MIMVKCRGWMQKGRLEMDFQSTFKKVLLAGVGAASIGAEKGKELIDNLAEKGAISVEEGKKLNEELKKKYSEKFASKKEERMNDYVKNMSKKGLEKYISFDFGSLSKYKYYTGIIFSAFTYGTGQPIAKGGRYDGLLSHFGNDKAAVGVGLYIEQIMNALFRKNIAEEKK